MNVSLVEAFLLARGVSREELTAEVVDDPRLIFGLSAAAEAIGRAIDAGKTIAVFGDYDADGLASAALMARGLRGLSSSEKVRVVVPQRTDGYGINEIAVRQLARSGAEMIVTTDNGTHCVKALELAARLGVEVVVTDHHLIPDPSEVAPAAVLVNPQHPQSQGAFGQLCGTGVAWFVLEEMYRRAGRAMPEEWSALAALATVADVVPMTGVNRALVRRGLAAVGGIEGIKALRTEAQVNHVDPEAIAFQIAPRLNAAGRMGDPKVALDLLLTDDEYVARELAGECAALNASRKQTMDDEVLRGLDAALRAPDEEGALVVFDEEISPGIAGLVAGRLADKFGVPVVVGSVDFDTGRISGSARSGRSGVNCERLLKAAGDALTDSGGHEAAAGFRLALANGKVARERILAAAAEMMRGVSRELVVTADVHLPRLPTIEELRELDELGPWGNTMPKPTLASSGVTVTAVNSPRGKFTTVELDDGLTRTFAFSYSPLDIEAGDRVTLVYQPDLHKGLHLTSIGPNRLAVDVGLDIPSPVEPPALKRRAVGF